MRWRQVHAVWDFQCSNQRTLPLSLQSYCAVSQAISEVLSICPFIQPLTIANSEHSHEFVSFYAYSFIAWRLHPFHAYCIFKDQTSSWCERSDIVWSKSAPGKHTPSLTTNTCTDVSHPTVWAWLWERPWGLREPVSVYCMLSYLRWEGVVLDLCPFTEKFLIE